jgi:hypothetical protein
MHSGPLVLIEFCSAAADNAAASVNINPVISSPYLPRCQMTQKTDGEREKERENGTEQTFTLW